MQDKRYSHIIVNMVNIEEESKRDITLMIDAHPRALKYGNLANSCGEYLHLSGIHQPDEPFVSKNCHP
ncbi:hypothetical protein TNCV_1510682 [Trichonephila clavipes]|nr:hypothetical protein TNCV_1510682 [Trichonephila clavipes]